MRRSRSIDGRILVVDDYELVHQDYRKVLCPDRTQSDAMIEIESFMFGTNDDSTPTLNYELDFATQGEEAAVLVQNAVDEGRPYRLAFVDMRMPPGWDGLRTMVELRRIDPKLQFVICSAYSDYNPEEINARLGTTGTLHLPKPFAAEDIREIAYILGSQSEVAF